MIVQVTAQQLARLTCRSLAVYALVHALGRTSQLAWLASLPGAEGAASARSLALAGYAAETGALLALAWMLWSFAGRIALRMLSPHGTESGGLHMQRPGDEALIHRIALSTLGLGILVHSAPAGLAWATRALALGAGQLSPPPARLDTALQLGELALRTALAAYLVLGGPALADALRRAWLAARAPRPAGETPGGSTSAS